MYVNNNPIKYTDPTGHYLCKGIDECEPPTTPSWWKKKSEIKKLNPHIRQWCTPPNMENVVLYLPHGLADTFKVFYETLSDDDKVRWFRYRIKSGDNLLSIAGRFKISVPAIKLFLSSR